MKRRLIAAGFHFVRHLGRGGTAHVAEVALSINKQRAALKFADPDAETDESAFERLARREYDLIGGIRFPGLVRLLDEPAEDPVSVLLELCPGPALDEVGRIDDLPTALNILSALAGDLEYLRARRLVHGDLKPQNVFLPPQWESQCREKLFFVKVSDFSLGRKEDEDESVREGTGTLGFMAPETIRAGRASHRSDLFAFGAIAYQLLTGRHPFLEGERDPARINSAVLEHEPPSVGDLRPNIPTELSALVNELLAKDEARRPASGIDVCRRLRELGAGYKYELLLHPRYYIDCTQSYETNLSEVLSLSDDEESRLEVIAGGDTAALRQLLTVNFRRGHLAYREGRFSFVNGIIWPMRLRRRTLWQFSQASMATKRDLIRTAVVGDGPAAEDLGVIGSGEASSISEALVRILGPLLRAVTVRRLSKKYAGQAERAERHGLASRLYVQAGQLDEAERCALQRATVLHGRDANREALACIRTVVDYARLIRREFDVRELLTLRGQIFKKTGETDLARDTYLSIIDLYEGRDPDKLLAETHKFLGDVYRMKADADAGIDCLKKALEIFTKLGDRLDLSRAQNNLANLYWLTGDTARSLATYRAALRIQHHLGSPPETASTLSNIGGVYYTLGRYDRSLRVMHLALEMVKRQGNAGEIARCLNNVGFVHHVVGDSQQGVECLSESLTINRRIGSKKEILINLENLSAIMIAAGQLRQSVAHIKEGMELASSLNDTAHVGIFHGEMGQVLLHMGRYDEAHAALMTARTYVDQVDDRPLHIMCSMHEAELRFSLGDYDAAAARTQYALQTAEEIKDRQYQVKALILLARASSTTDHLNRAEELARQQHFAREIPIIQFSAIEAFLEAGNHEQALMNLESVLALPLEIPERIELPWMCNLAAEVLIQNGRYADAAPYLARATRIASAAGPKTELVTAQTLSGQLAFHDGDYERSFSEYKQGLGVCRSLAGSIASADDQAKFQNRRSILLLTKEIRRLSTLMAKKERAG